MKNFAATLAATLMLFLSFAVQAADAPQVATGASAITPQMLDLWWKDLQESEPRASAALLNFSSHPKETIEFFREHLRPLKIEVDDLNLLLSALGSAKESEWKAACEQLEYFDPRLAMNLETLMGDVPDEPARSRLVDILCDYPPGTHTGKRIELRKIGKGEGFNFFDGHGSWWAEDKVARLGSSSWGGGKKKWQRSVRAMVLLKHIGTPEAMAIVQEMTTGHPDAFPTRVAKETIAATKGT
jgi:hypothetical protein